MQKQFRSLAPQENSVSAILAMLLMHSREQSPVGMVFWATATPAKVAARTEKDFILSVGVVVIRPKTMMFKKKLSEIGY